MAEGWEVVSLIALVALALLTSIRKDRRDPESPSRDIEEAYRVWLIEQDIKGDRRAPQEEP